MTKKSKNKASARAAQERHGGRYTHYLRQLAPGALGAFEGAAGAALLTLPRLRMLAEASVPEEITRLGAAYSSLGTVFVVADGGDAVAERVVALGVAAEKSISGAAALAGVREHVLARAREGQHGAYIGAVPWPTLRSWALDGPGERGPVVRALGDRFTGPLREGRVHVLLLAEGQMQADSVPAAATCHCGHLVSEHHAGGACTWRGVPSGPFMGFTDEMSRQARRRGLVMKCPCGGPMVLVDDRGRVAGRLQGARFV